MAANCGIDEGFCASCRTPTCVMLGAISLSNSNHFPLVPYSPVLKPVALLPGRPKLSTNMAATGSVTATNTIGMEGVARCNARTLGLALARMTSGASATNSVAYLEMLLTSGLQR